MRQVMECIQLINDNGGWLVVEQLHASGGDTKMSWFFPTREAAERHLSEAQSAHRLAYQCRLADSIVRPPKRRPVG